ncbi:hypothetical protein OROMI_027646 [Orobanche minor]
MNTDPSSHPHLPQPSTSMYPPPPPYGEETQPQPKPNTEKWGTHVMGTPAVPTCHPNNQKAALWGLRTGSSVSEAAWGKVNLRAKTITGGGFEALYKQTFSTYPNEMLKKTFACYLSTSTGPVAGTLYLSNVHVAFCSDRPLSFTAPSGQETWSYYKVLIPLAKIGSINPVIMRDNPRERYIQAVSSDGHDFWFMGFVNYEKASHHLFEGLSTFAAAGVPVVG